jgi:hypothetical protein
MPRRPIDRVENNARLEVNGMHALHRPHVLRAMMVTLIAAVLAIVLTLALATSLNDLASTPAPAGAADTPYALPASATSHGWHMSPFAPLLSAPPAVPWAPPPAPAGPGS